MNRLPAASLADHVHAVFWPRRFQRKCADTVVGELLEIAAVAEADPVGSSKLRSHADTSGICHETGSGSFGQHGGSFATQAFI
jgi:hypothetical protein